MDGTCSMKLRNMAAWRRKRHANNEPAARRCLFAFPRSLRPPVSALIPRRFSRQTCPYITRQLLERPCLSVGRCCHHVFCMWRAYNQQAGHNMQINSFLRFIYIQKLVRALIVFQSAANRDFSRRFHAFCHATE